MNAAGEDEVRDTLTVHIATEPRAHNRPGVHLIGQTDARLEKELLHVRVAARQIVKQAVVLARRRSRNVLGRVCREAVAPQHRAVQWIARAGDRIAGRRIHLDGGRFR